MGSRLTLKNLHFPSVSVQHTRQDGFCCGDTRFLLQSLEEDVHHVSDPNLYQVYATLSLLGF
jgi:hypothetical protein